MFKNILSQQNHNSLIYHHLRNVHPWVSNKSSDHVLIYKKPGKTPSLQRATAVSEETEQNQPNKRQQRNSCHSLTVEAAHTWWTCQWAPCWPSHPSAQLLFGTPLGIPQIATGRAVWEHTAHDETSLPTGSTQHQLPSPSTAGPLLPFSASLPERNAFSLHLGVQTIHQQEWQQNNTNTSRLQSARRYTNTLTSKVLPGLRDAEDKRLKTCSKMRLKSLPCFTASGKTPATFLKTSTLQEVKITLQTCLVVCCTQRVDQEKYRTKEYKIRSKT